MDWIPASIERPNPPVFSLGPGTSSSAHPSPEANASTRKRGGIRTEKCTYCRAHKKKCIPDIRQWDPDGIQEKCSFCKNGGYACSASQMAPKKRTRLGEPGALNIVAEPSIVLPTLISSPEFIWSLGDEHYQKAFCALAEKSIQQMSKSFEKETYNPNAPEKLPKELQYACEFWVRHLQASRNQNLLDGELQKQVYAFLYKHFLHWIQALSLIKKLSHGADMVKLMKSILTESHANPRILDLIQDAQRLILRFGSIIETYPHQIFLTAIAFSPKNSEIRQQFWDQTHPRLKHVINGVEAWNYLQGTLEGHSASVSSVAFSPDGKTVASGSHDRTVRLWDTGTGAVRQTLEGHSASVSSVAFSPDGKTVASGSLDETIRLWDTGTGAVRQTLEGHSDSVSSVAFWDNAAGMGRQSLQGTLSLQSVIVGVKGDWVTLNEQETLWLPPDFRPGHFAVHNSVIAIGCPSGRVFFIHFYSSNGEEED